MYTASPSFSKKQKTEVRLNYVLANANDVVLLALLVASLGLLGSRRGLYNRVVGVRWQIVEDNVSSNLLVINRKADRSLLSLVGTSCESVGNFAVLGFGNLAFCPLMVRLEYDGDSKVKLTAESLWLLMVTLAPAPVKKLASVE